MQKIWLLKVFGIITSKKKTLNMFSNLSSSNVHPINAHTKVDTCHKSPKNFKFKPIIILGKIGQIYSMVEMKTLKKEKICLVIKS